MVELLHGLLMNEWPSAIGDVPQIPNEWKNSRIISLYKGRGSMSAPDSYRSIFLLDVVGKLFATILKRRLQPIVENRISDWQYGFRPGRSTVDLVHTLRRAQEAA